MSAEHKRPLVAFITVALLCGLFMGHAIRSEALGGVLRALPGPAGDLLRSTARAARTRRSGPGPEGRAGGRLAVRAASFGAADPVPAVRPDARVAPVRTVGRPAKGAPRAVASRPGPRVPTPPGVTPAPPVGPPSTRRW